MTTARLIAYLCALPDYAVRELPEPDRVALARECLRIVRATSTLTPPTAAPAPRSGVLGKLADGERAP